jgi:hypothetical protein
MIREGLRKRLRGLFRARPFGGGEAAEAAPEREAALTLLSPDGRERLIFNRRGDGLWTYVREAFHIEPEHALGYWAPTGFSGLYDGLPEARRDAEAGGEWAVEGDRE